MSRIAVGICLALALSAATGAAAHGPTVQLTRSKVAPPQLALSAGEVVHFHNASTTPRTFTVRAEDGSFESPPLARGEGWHHAFDVPGRHPFFVVEKPDLRGEVLVAPPP